MDRLRDYGTILAWQHPSYLHHIPPPARLCRAATELILWLLVQGLCQVIARQHTEKRRWLLLIGCTKIILSVQ